jgi:hypothetical protein
VQDVSTNGTGIRPGGSLDDDERITLSRDEVRPLGRPTWSSCTPASTWAGPDVGHRRGQPAGLGDGRGPDDGDPQVRALTRRLRAAQDRGQLGHRVVQVLPR